MPSCFRCTDSSTCAFFYIHSLACAAAAAARAPDVQLLAAMSLCLYSLCALCEDNLFADPALLPPHIFCICLTQSLYLYFPSVWLCWLMPPFLQGLLKQACIITLCSSALPFLHRVILQTPPPLVAQLYFKDEWTHTERTGKLMQLGNLWGIKRQGRCTRKDKADNTEKQAKLDKLLT